MKIPRFKKNLKEKIMKTIVVIGANRGIGLEFTRQYLEEGCLVHATYRNKTTAQTLKLLQGIYSSQLFLHELEVTDLNQIYKLSRTISKVHILILNAGIKGYPTPNTRPCDNNESELYNALRVNTVAPDNLMRAFFQKLLQSENSCAVYISSLLARIADNSSGGSHPYRISKTAANALIRNWDIELKKSWNEKKNSLADAPCAFSLCPGWVKTEMGGPNARLEIDKSVANMRSVIEQIQKTKNSNGLYMYDGTMAESYPEPKN